MLLRTINKHRLVKARIILSLYSYWLICSLVFSHIHILKSGEVIQHKHAYPVGKKTSDHHHNENEIRTFSSEFLFEILPNSVEYNPNPVIIDWFVIWNITEAYKHLLPTIFHIKYRGPPQNISLISKIVNAITVYCKNSITQNI